MTRTHDLLITNQLLYQLSYSSVCNCRDFRLTDSGANALQRTKDTTCLASRQAWILWRTKLFLYTASFSRIIFPRGAYTGKICICKGGVLMDPVFPHGDVDDLIYRAEWAARDR